MIQPKTILLVDDDAMLRVGLSTMLQQKGYRTLEADDGVEARDLINAQRPDLVILDMMMPRWGGFAVLEHFQENPPAPPFIMLSGHDGRKHQAYAKKIGVVDFLHKPCSMERLLATVDRQFNPQVESVAAGQPWNGSAPRVLLLEIHKPLQRALKHGLEDDGFTVDIVEDAAEADRKSRESGYDIIILDLMQPTFDGFQLLKNLNKAGHSSHVLVLTAKNTMDDKVKSLDLGADDCLTRPFQLAELLARTRALVRRRRKVKDPVLRIHDLEIDPAARIVRRAGQIILLTPREFALLQFLAAHRGKVVTRSMIWEKLYGEQDERTSNVVDVYVRYLRQKLDMPFDKKLILTRWGEGYMLCGDGE